MVDYVKAGGVTYAVSYVLNFALSSTRAPRMIVLAYTGYCKAVAKLEEADSSHEQNEDVFRSY